MLLKSTPAGLGREADRVLRSKYGPTAAVVLGPCREVLEVRGDAAPFLRLPSGALPILLGRFVVDAGLLREVEALLDETGRTGKPARRERLNYAVAGLPGEVGVEVLPLESRGRCGHLIVFEARNPHLAGDGHLATEVVGRLAGEIAHDFNNLLTVVIGHCDLLALRLAGNRLVADHVDPIRQSAERATMLTEQFLALSRREVVQSKRLDLGTVLTEVECMLRSVLGENIEIEVRVPTGLWGVFADSGEMVRVVLNLALNARDAMPGGGVLVFEVGNWFFAAEGDAPDGLPAGRYVALTVQDDGVGVKPDLLEHIFEPFFTTKGDSKGTGLGLSSVRAVVHDHGGTVACDSTPGVGTKMTVLLPAGEAVLSPVRCYSPSR